ncbi:SOS response-associated peptidase family protein [Acinetobacter beijerinckii]|uniref:SOS response-associated peptidase family protein n=1 Tax=Acinetobacter beijerinckii TaxID=262668 RepID=UPI003AF7219F
MCANYEPIRRSQVLQLKLLEPSFDYSADIYPGYDCPLLFAPEEQLEWRQVKFGMVPRWAKDLKICRKTYNARTETVHEKPSFKHAWYKSNFALIPVSRIFEPKYFEGKPEWWGIYRKDEQPFTVAALYENAMIDGQQIRSMTMLTINADHHPFMKQFHAPNDEKRSIIVIPEQYRMDWLKCNYQDAPDFFFDMESDEYTAAPKSEMNKFRPNTH